MGIFYGTLFYIILIKSNFVGMTEGQTDKMTFRAAKSVAKNQYPGTSWPQYMQNVTTKLMDVNKSSSCG